MAKLKLVANPTFKAKVLIPVAGGAPVSMEFTFKHRTKSQLDEFGKSLAGQSDGDAFMEMLEGWDFEEEFSRASVDLLLENYMGAPLAVYETYKNELVQAKTKN